MYGRNNIANDDDDDKQQQRPPASSAVSSTTASNNIGMYDAYNRSAAFSNSSGGGGNFNDSFRSPTPISIHDTFIGSEERVGGGPSTGRGSDSSSLSRSDYDSGGNNEAGEEASGE